MVNTDDINIQIIAPISPHKDFAGGTSTSVSNIIHFLKYHFKFILVGISFENEDIKYNKYKDVEFFSAANIKLKHINRLSSLRYAVGLFKNKKYISKIKSILHVQRADSALPLLYPVKIRNPVIVHIRGSNTYWKYLNKSYLFRLLVKITERLVVVKADKIIMVSKKGMCEYHEIYNKYKDKIIYIPNGINIDKFIPIPNRNMTRYDFGIPYDQKVILYTGRFVKEKGIYLILKSFERVCRNITNCMLIFVGNGPLITEIQKYSAIYSNIKILLKVANDQMPYIYNTADTLVMGSYYEGWSNTLGEALACGVPVVTTNVGDAEELIYEGKNGYISYTRDPAEFANKCMLCLQNSDSMRKHARKSISAYSLENMANQLKNVYNELSRC